MQPRPYVYTRPNLSRRDTVRPIPCLPLAVSSAHARKLQARADRFSDAAQQLALIAIASAVIGTIASHFLFTFF